MDHQKIIDIIYNINIFTKKSNQAIIDTGEYLIIQTDYFISREYNFIASSELLFSIEDNFPNHKLIFLIKDGANLELSGMQELIKQIASDRPPNSCYIRSHAITSIPNTIYLSYPVYNNFLHICYSRLQKYPIASNNFSKKFAGLFGRHDIYRLRLFRHLHTLYADDSIISYRSDPTKLLNFQHLDSYLIDKDWAKSNCPVRFDPLTEEEQYVCYDSLLTIGNHYEKYFIEIISETDPNSAEFLTEKTMKNFWLGKPFLLMAGPGALEYLHSQGFKTFAPFIDESYDTIINPYKRLQKIQFEIDRLGSMSLSELKNLHQNLIPIFTYNREFVREKYAIN